MWSSQTFARTRTSASLARLVPRFVRETAHAFVIELASLGGRDRLLPVPTVSIVRYD